jgi:hypothetical protein
MKRKNILPYIAGPALIFLTVSIIFIAVSFLQMITIETIRMFAYTKRQASAKVKTKLTQEEERIQRIRRSSKEFLPDGTIHLVYELRSQLHQTSESQIVQIYDANDHLLWEGPRHQTPYEYLSWTEESIHYGEAFTLRRLREIQMLTPVFSQTIEVPVGTLNNTEQIWRYHPGADHFVGYNTDGEKTGYISAAGYTNSKSKAKPFGQFRLFTARCPRDSSNPTLLWQTQKRVYEINFEKRRVELIFESIDSDIEAINLHAWRDRKPEKKDSIIYERTRPLLVCITTDGKRHLTLRNPNQQITVQTLNDRQGWISTHRQFIATKQDIFLLDYWLERLERPDPLQDRKLYDQWWRDYEKQGRKYRVELHKMNDGGGFQMLNHYTWTVPVQGRSDRTESTMAPSRRFITSFSPALYNTIVRALSRKFWSRVIQAGNRGNFFCTMLRVPLELRPLSTIINLLVSVLMMGFVFWHGLPRRISYSRFVFWLVLVCVFNLIGLLTYLALNHTTVITCPACGGRRGLAPAQCVRCNAPLPIPNRRELDLICR